MQVRPNRSAVSDDAVLVDEIVLLDAFWRVVTRKIARNYPEMSEDDVRESVSSLFVDVNAAACARQSDTPDGPGDDAVMPRLRAACSDVVRRAAGSDVAPLAARQSARPLESAALR